MVYSIKYTVKIFVCVFRQYRYLNIYAIQPVLLQLCLFLRDNFIRCKIHGNKMKMFFIPVGKEGGVFFCVIKTKLIIQIRKIRVFRYKLKLGH